MFIRNENNIVNNNKILLLIIIVLVMFSVSNPKKEDFVEYKVKSINEHELIGNEFTSGLTKLIGKPLISATTERKNFLIFSVYTTSDNNQYIGFLKRYFIEF